MSRGNGVLVVWCVWVLGDINGGGGGGGAGRGSGDIKGLSKCCCRVYMYYGELILLEG